MIESGTAGTGSEAGRTKMSLDGMA